LLIVAGVKVWYFKARKRTGGLSMAFEPNKPMRNIRFGAKDPATNVVQWICSDANGTLSHSLDVEKSHIYPSLTEEEVKRIVRYIKKNFPGYLIGVFEVTSH
jgi:hypothetical protein